MIEHFFICPYCWQHISILLDTTIKEQSFIEDCEVCCNPIDINAMFISKELTGFDAKGSQ